MAAAVLKIVKSRYLMMIQSRSFKRIGRTLSCICKIKFLTPGAFERHILHHRVKFCFSKLEISE